MLDAGIVEIILLILKLIHYKIYCHCELEPQNKEQRLVDFKTIPDKTAQKIASIKLLKTINVLYDVTFILFYELIIEQFKKKIDIN